MWQVGKEKIIRRDEWTHHIFFFSLHEHERIEVDFTVEVYVGSAEPWSTCIERIVISFAITYKIVSGRREDGGNEEV